MSEIPPAIDSKMGVILSRDEEDVSKDDEPFLCGSSRGAADEPRVAGELGWRDSRALRVGGTTRRRQAK